MPKRLTIQRHELPRFQKNTLTTEEKIIAIREANKHLGPFPFNSESIIERTNWVLELDLSVLRQTKTTSKQWLMLLAYRWNPKRGYFSSIRTQAREMSASINTVQSRIWEMQRVRILDVLYREDRPDNHAFYKIVLNEVEQWLPTK